MALCSLMEGSSRMAGDAEFTVPLSGAFGGDEMARHRQGLEGELASAGFSTRTINALIYGLQLQSVDELRSAEWAPVGDKNGLATTLGRIPNMGAKGLAEVQAFREQGDARQAIPSGPSSVSARLRPNELASLDAWAAAHGMSRAEAIRTMLLSALQLDD
jgi:Ribbon-helix-helix protein, copG family